MTPTPKGEVRVRLAPSPTGPMHVGTARTGLFNWLFARQNKGQFLLRIEDTDQERSKKEYEENIIKSLKWLGLNWDEEPIRQSERAKIHKKYLEKLLQEGKAYYCYCTKEDLEAERGAMIAEGLPPKYSGHCRELKKPRAQEKPNVIRFKTPEVKVEFKDLVRGRVKFDAGLIGDIVIAKNLETPLYNFAAAIDDAETKITHVIRGEDHISNTPKQILFQKALGLATPTYAHLPLILAPDRSKLSKRYGEVALLKYREMGYLKEAMINFLALLGWHPQGNQEIFTLDELIKIFKLEKVQKGGAVFDQEKLDWINIQYIKQLTTSALLDRLTLLQKARNITAPKEFMERVMAVERERMKTLNDFFKLADFFFELPVYEPNLLKWKEQSLPEAKIILTKILTFIENIKPADFKQQAILASLNDLVRAQGQGEILWPLRVALSGKTASPGPLIIAEILGQEETVKRIKFAIDKLENA